MTRLVFSTQSYRYMADAICTRAGFEAGKTKRTEFSDGERLINIQTPPKDRDVLLVGGTINDSETLELFDLACGVVTRGTNTLSLLIPYFGYSTQERSVDSGDVVTAKARAIILSSIPRARLTNEAFVFDLHTEGIGHYFEGPLHCHHIRGHKWMQGLVQDIAKSSEAVVAATDAGRAKWIERLANLTHLPAAFVYKRRSGEKTEISGVNADVKAKHVILYDDMVRSGSSMINAARVYRKAGASAITGVFSHAVLPGGSAQKMVDSQLFDALHTTDSHPGSASAKKAGMTVHAMTDYFLNHL